MSDMTSNVLRLPLPDPGFIRKLDINDLFTYLFCVRMWNSLFLHILKSGRELFESKIFVK